MPQVAGKTPEKTGSAFVDGCWPWGRSGVVFGLAALLAAPVACRSERRDLDPARACARACDALLASGCERPGSRPADAVACQAHCVDATASAERAGCASERSAYLACVSGSKLDCSRECGAPICLERGEGLGGCSAEHDKLATCLSPCARHGTVSTFERGSGAELLRAEVIHAGCGRSPQADRRAPVGSECSAASVCSQSICKCADARAEFLARVCRGGTCREGEEACRALDSVRDGVCR